MNILEMSLVALVIVVLLAMPLVPVFLRKLTGKKAKHFIVGNLCAFGGVMLLAIAMPFVNTAFASNDAPTAATEQAEDVAEDAASGTEAGLAYIGAALATGLSSLAAGIAVAAAAPAAIGAVSEDDKNFVKSLIFVALGEGCAIYGLLISIMILGKV